MTGLLLVDKPAGMTSHDVVDCIRKASGIRRVGHTGTLDPAATGLLLICLGKATRLSEHLTGLDKTYEGVMRLGLVTDSFDMDGTVTDEQPIPAGVDAQRIQDACNQYVGEIEQMPPMVSAVKVGGERLYKKARKGETVEREPRPVSVYEFMVLDYTEPDARVRVRCSRGTYVRSLCHDVGQDLGCGAVLAELRRTAVGRHTVDAALSVDAFTDAGVVRERLVSMGDALDLPTVVLMPEALETVKAGNTVTSGELLEGCPVNEGWVQMKSEAGDLLALGTVQATAVGARVHPKRVFM